jgi:CDP-4-dehydro-6-deoxyglucose reductase
MSYTISVKNKESLQQNASFTCEENENVVEAAVRQSVAIAYGCRNGGCGSCKGKVLSGEYHLKSHDPQVLTENDRENGTTLLCCVEPKTDLLIEAKMSSSAQNVLKMPVRVISLEKVGTDVMVLKVQIPSTQNFRFQAGQYIDFLLKDGERRSYSMANAPSEIKDQLVFHIRWMSGGLFTSQLFEQIKEKDLLRIEGPLGDFYLREEKAPLIFLASGTGFAPIRSILKSIQDNNDSNRYNIDFYWGARTKSDLYAHDEVQKIVQDLNKQGHRVNYTPVLSEPSSTCLWSGRTGLVHQAVLNDHTDLSLYHVYACGAPVMVNAAHQNFVQQAQLKEDHFFSDSFVSKADLQIEKSA